jgi:hypothetical protein
MRRRYSGVQRRKVGHVEIELQPLWNPKTDRRTDHSTRMPFAAYLDQLENPAEPGKPRYMNGCARMFDPGPDSLLEDVIVFPKFLHNPPEPSRIKLIYGAENALTPLHQDECNLLFAQVKGRKRFLLVPHYQLQQVYDNATYHCPVHMEEPDYERFPLLRDATIYDVTVHPGEVLFLPTAWYHWVRSLDETVSLVFDHFRFPAPSYIFQR